MIYAAHHVRKALSSSSPRLWRGTHTCAGDQSEEKGTSGEKKGISPIIEIREGVGLGWWPCLVPRVLLLVVSSSMCSIELVRGRPFTLLVLLAVEQGISLPDEIEQMVREIGRSNNRVEEGADERASHSKR